MKKHIPNVLTLFNLFCGCCAVICVFQGHFTLASWFIFASLLADYLDGMVARMLKVQSPIGKELDSLADVVSFGVVPGTVIYVLLAYGRHQFALPPQLDLLAAPAFLLSVFAALRLAKFNLDTRQGEEFIGLPTPSVTIFTIGLMLIYQQDLYGWRWLMVNNWFLYSCIAILSYLMIAEIPMFNMKFRNFDLRENAIRLVFTALALTAFLLLGGGAFSLIILMYIGISIFQFFVKLPK